MDSRFYQELAKCFFEEASDALFVIDPDTGAVTDANPMAQQLTGFGRKELLRMSFPDLLLTDDEQVAERLRRALTTTSVPHSREEYRLRRQAGVPLHVDVSVSRVHVQPKPLALAVVRDITRRKEEESALRLREAVLAATGPATGRLFLAAEWEAGLQDMLAGLGQATGADRVYAAEIAPGTDEGPVARHRFEWTQTGGESGEAPPREFSLGYGPLARWGEILKAGNALCGRLEDLPRAERAYLERRNVASTAVVPVHAGPDWWGLIGLEDCGAGRQWPVAVVDALTAAAGTLGAGVLHRRTAEAVVRASRLEAVTTLAGGIAHDLNNRMTGVLSNVALLRLKSGEGSDAGRELADITSSAREAGELAKKLLAYARGGKRPPEAMDLNSTVIDALQLQRATLPSAVRVTHDLQGDLWSIRADPSQMSQVVMNLCLNAVEAVEGEGTVKVTSRNLAIDPDAPADPRELTPGRWIALTVADSGCGIDPATTARVYEPFFTTKSRGRGLGLAAVQRIVRNHRGHIALESTAGVGTSFTVYLPAGESRPAPEPRPTADVPGRTNTVLLVDDEVALLSAVALMLTHLGYAVLTAQDGQAAVDLVRAHDGDIDVAVTDLRMPVMDGVTAFPLLREARPDMKIIICTAYDPGNRMQELIAGGAAGFVQKPFTARQLAAQIRSVLA